MIMKLFVHLTPNAKHEKIEKQTDLQGQEVRKIRVKAPPIDGKANKALINFLAEHLDLPKSSISIIHGQTGRHKVVKIAE